LLERLWNIDKHQVLVGSITAQSGGFKDAYTPIRDVASCDKSRFRLGKTLNAQTELARVKITPSGPDPYVKMESIFSVQIEDPTRPDRNLIEDLLGAGMLVSAIVAAFPGGGREDERFKGSYERFPFCRYQMMVRS
jgi:hypothetical protein